MTMDKNYGDSTPLAFIAYGVTAVLMNIHSADFFQLDSMLLSLSALYAGFGQVIAGAMAFLRGDIFCTTTFTSYGLYWIATALMMVLPDWSDRPPTSRRFVGWFNLVWFVVTAFFTVGTLKGPKAVQLVYVSMTLLFLLNAIANLAESDTVTKIAGWEGILS
eukprot:gene10220-15714_t